jgi:hypothetical protein
VSALSDAGRALREQHLDFARSCDVLQELVKLELETAEQHPLGFYRVDVTAYMSDCRPRERFYLHVWRPDVPIDSLGLIHTHIFSMASVVLKGCLENIIYRVERSTGTTSGSIGEYLVEYTKQGAVVPRGDVQLIAVQSARIGEGCVYGVELGTPHETRVVSYPTVTLIRKVFPAQPDSGPLVYSTDAVESRSSERPRLKIRGAAALLEQGGAEHDR